MARDTKYRLNEHGYMVAHSPILRRDDGSWVSKAILQHRVVLGLQDRYTGDNLQPDLVVHHINGIKHDNRPENLQVMTQAEHMRLERIKITRLRKIKDRSAALQKSPSSQA